MCRVPLASPVPVVDHHRSSTPTGRRVEEGKVRERLSGRIKQVPACTRPATSLLAIPAPDRSPRRKQGTRRTMPLLALRAPIQENGTGI